MTCPSCGNKDMTHIPEANLYRCGICNWTVVPEPEPEKPKAKPSSTKAKTK